TKSARLANSDLTVPTSPLAPGKRICSPSLAIQPSPPTDSQERLLATSTLPGCRLATTSLLLPPGSLLDKPLLSHALVERLRGSWFPLGIMWLSSISMRLFREEESQAACTLRPIRRLV